MAVHVRLDWKAYFAEFCRRHGEPVRVGGRLLFPDGWQYSATDHAGPEWPPPLTDSGQPDMPKIDRLRRTYWIARRRAVRTELRQLTAKIEALLELQSGKSVPLMQVVRQQEDGGGGPSVKTVPLDMSLLEARAAWLRADAAECKARLADLPRGEGVLMDVTG